MGHITSRRVKTLKQTLRKRNKKLICEAATHSATGPKWHLLYIDDHVVVFANGAKSSIWSLMDTLATYER